MDVSINIDLLVNFSLIFKCHSHYTRLVILSVFSLSHFSELNTFNLNFTVHLSYCLWVKMNMEYLRLSLKCHICNHEIEVCAVCEEVSDFKFLPTHKAS